MDYAIPSDVKTEILQITPDMAKKLLNGSKDSTNRQVSRSVVNKYIKDMKSGRWKFVGDTIKLSKRGIILDGQHRLSAIATSGISLPMVVVKNIDDAAFFVMDSGRSRNFRDVLHIMGMSDENLISSVINIVLRLERGEATPQRERVSVGELLNCYYNYTDQMHFIKSLKVSCNKNKPPFNNSSICAFAAYLLHKKEDRRSVMDFLDQIIKGCDLGEKSPSLCLRKYIQNAKDNKVVVRNYDQTMHLFKAYKLTKLGIQISRTKDVLFRGKDDNESFDSVFISKTPIEEAAA